MTAALRAEWTKVHTIAGPAWLLLTTVTVTIAFGVTLAATVTCPRAGCRLDLTRLSLTGVQLGQAPVAILAVLLVAGEYSTGLVAATVTATPRRPTVLAAKATVLVLVTASAGCIAAVACLLVTRAPASMTTVRAGAGSVLYLILIALLSLGVAAAARDSAASIAIVLGLLYLPAIFAGIFADPQWQRFLQRVGPMNAGLAVQATTGLRDLPLSPWAGLGVLAAWAATALLAGVLLFHRRDL